MERILLVVRYAGDVERKRVDYLLSRYSGRVRSERLHGSTIILEGSWEVFEELLRELYARIPRERVEAYRIERVDVDVEPSRFRGVVEARGLGLDEAWGAVELMARRLRGVLVSQAGGERRYRLYVRGGVADALFRVRDGLAGAVIEFIVEGYGPHVEQVYREVLRELSYLRG